MLYVITLLGADSWMESGVQGLQSVVLYSLPELDGAIETMVLGKSAVVELSLCTRSNSTSALLCCQQYFNFFVLWLFLELVFLLLSILLFLLLLS